VGQTNLIHKNADMFVTIYGFLWLALSDYFVAINRLYLWHQTDTKDTHCFTGGLR